MLSGVLVDLVPFSKRFANLDHKWENGPSHFWADAGDRSVFSRAQIEAGRREWLDMVEQGKATGFSFGIQTKDGTPIGGMGFNWIDYYNRTANMGASIGEPEYWGGGYGTDALLLIVDFAFNWLDLRKVWLDTMGINVRVQRQMQKIGFVLEARLRDLFYVDGQPCDSLSYGLLREEWLGRAVMIDRLGLRAAKEE